MTANWILFGRRIWGSESEIVVYGPCNLSVFLHSAREWHNDYGRADTWVASRNC